MDILFLGADWEAFSASSCHTRHLEGLLRPTNRHQVQHACSSMLQSMREQSVAVVIVDATATKMESSLGQEKMLDEVLRVARRGYIFNAPVRATPREALKHAA